MHTNGDNVRRAHTHQRRHDQCQKTEHMLCNNVHMAVHRPEAHPPLAKAHWFWLFLATGSGSPWQVGTCQAINRVATDNS